MPRSFPLKRADNAHKAHEAQRVLQQQYLGLATVFGDGGGSFDCVKPQASQSLRLAWSFSKTFIDFSRLSLLICCFVSNLVVLVSTIFNPVISIWPCSFDNVKEHLDKYLSKGTKSVHVAALDGLVSVNSLFTVAVFIGLSLANPEQKSLEGGGACDAGPHIVKNLVIFEVVSFSSFLFSSLIAQGLKSAITIINSKDSCEAVKDHVKFNNMVLRIGMLVSAIGTVIGCIFLVLSMINVIQITLGTLSCGVSSTVKATSTLIVLVSTALIFYISTVIYAVTH